MKALRVHRTHFCYRTVKLQENIQYSVAVGRKALAHFMGKVMLPLLYTVHARDLDCFSYFDIAGKAQV